VNQDEKLSIGAIVDGIRAGIVIAVSLAVVFWSLSIIFGPDEEQCDHSRDVSIANMLVGGCTQ